MPNDNNTEPLLLVFFFFREAGNTISLPIAQIAFCRAPRRPPFAALAASHRATLISLSRSNLSRYFALCIIVPGERAGIWL